MTAIFKVGFNVIHSRHRAECEGGEIGPSPIVYTDCDGSASENPLPFKPITGGQSDDSQTVAADDAEDAIAKVRTSVVGSRIYFQADWLDDGKMGEDGGVKYTGGEWLCDVVESIQIVRIEPVAFTTI